MSRLFFTNGKRPERLSRYPERPSFRTAGGAPPSARMGERWRTLPVEGSKAWRERQPILTRIFSR